MKVLILGQDPYPTPGVAHGLCFSVRPGVKAPASLRNIYRELQDDLGIAPAPRRPDDRAGFRGIDPPAVAPTIADPHPGASPRPDDRAGPRREPSVVASSAQPSLFGTDTGFDWVAAGAGAGSATGLILLLTAAALTLRRNHRRATTPA